MLAPTSQILRRLLWLRRYEVSQNALLRATRLADDQLSSELRERLLADAEEAVKTVLASRPGSLPEAYPHSDDAA